MILLPLFKKKVPRLHGNPQKLDALIFFNFHDPGYMKSTKIRRFNFLQLSRPRVHENPQKYDALIFFNFHDPGYMKIHKNQTIQRLRSDVKAVRAFVRQK